MDNSLLPDKDGIFTVDVAIHNPSSVTVTKMDIWIDICDGCQFASEPEGFTKLVGMRDETRYKIIEVFNPDTSSEKIVLKIRLVNRSMPYFQVGFRYSCSACELKAKEQVATIYVATPQ